MSSSEAGQTTQIQIWTLHSPYLPFSKKNVDFNTEDTTLFVPNDNSGIPLRVHPLQRPVEVSWTKAHIWWRSWWRWIQLAWFERTNLWSLRSKSCYLTMISINLFKNEKENSKCKLCNFQFWFCLLNLESFKFPNRRRWLFYLVLFFNFFIYGRR